MLRETLQLRRVLKLLQITLTVVRFNGGSINCLVQLLGTSFLRVLDYLAGLTRRHFGNRQSFVFRTGHVSLVIFVQYVLVYCLLSSDVVPYVVWSGYSAAAWPIVLSTAQSLNLFWIISGNTCYNCLLISIYQFL